MAVAIASSSQLSADAGAAVAEAGGNAVDAAIAANLVSMISEPGVCGLGAGGYAAVWPPDGSAVVVDGYTAAPGLGLLTKRLGGGGVDLHIDYGGGLHTVVGAGSVAVPGGLAAIEQASLRFGRLPWAALVEPAIETAERGFPMPGASYRYLRVSADSVYGLDRDGWACLHHADGELKKTGETVIVPGLADTLRRLASAGAQDFYTGDLAQRMADHVQELGGMLTREDLAAYRAECRPARMTRLGEWQVATNPPPAIGGSVLAAMLTLLDGGKSVQPGDAAARQLEAQIRVLGFAERRRRGVDALDDPLNKEIEALIDGAGGNEYAFLDSPSTVHTSAVDDSGLTAAITMSTGYGAGIMPPGTGIWLNNCLGELELVPRGPGAVAAAEGALEPGMRLPSNMAPTLSRNTVGAALAIGSPGAERITTALSQVLQRHLLLKQPLKRAVLAPRMHLHFPAGETRLAHEPFDVMPENAPPQDPFAPLSMYFGAVAAASLSASGGLEAVGDPRRDGGTRIAGP